MDNDNMDNLRAIPPESSSFEKSLQDVETLSPRDRMPPLKRRALNCLPCRQHKLKCDRQIPCLRCVRSGREEECRKHPAPARIPRKDPPRAKPNPLPSNTNQNLPSPISSQHDGYAPNTVSTEQSQSRTPRTLSNTEFSKNDNDASRPPPTGNKVGSIHMSDIYGILSGQESASLPNQRSGANPANFAPSLDGVSSVPIILFPGSGHTNVQEQELFWKQYLCSLLPTQSQCDILTLYYYEHINWIFQPVHVPSFRDEYAQFWNAEVQEIKLIWLSLLYTMISVSALYIPLETVEMVGVERDKIRGLAHVWHSASRQALHAGGYEARPCLTQLQTFSVTQLYWLATRNTEILNSAMGQAIRNAHAIGLHRDIAAATTLEKEMRHRMWWELCNSDTFQAICLSRPPLINCYHSPVPLPSNCNDIDLTTTSVNPRPLTEPTQMSQNIYRAKTFQILNRLYAEDGAYLQSWDYVSSINTELQNLIDDLPWYFQIPADNTKVHPAVNLPKQLDFLPWQIHILYSCICTQRIRMYRHFGTTESRAICAQAATSSFSIYKSIRATADTTSSTSFTRSPKFLAAAYQVFSIAVAIAALLIVECSSPSHTPASLRADVEMAIQDLDLGEASVPLAIDGRKILKRMLAIYDHRSGAGESEEIVDGISTVFGGETMARRYFRKQALNSETRDQEGLERNLDGGHDDELTQSIELGAEYDLQLMGMDGDLPLDIVDWWAVEDFGMDMYFTT